MYATLSLQCKRDCSHVKSSEQLSLRVKSRPPIRLSDTLSIQEIETAESQFDVSPLASKTKYLSEDL